MMFKWVELILPSLLLVPAMGYLSSLPIRGQLQAELRRKAFHMAIGLAALFLPVVLEETSTILWALVLSLGWLIAARTVPTLRARFGCVLHDTARASYGEMYFAMSIATLLVFSDGQTVLYVVPVLILTISDAAAAIVGRAFPGGKTGRLTNGKTLSGSAAFLASALAVTVFALLLLTNYSLSVCLALAITTAFASCLAEAVSSRGLDNLTVPAVTFLVLYPFVAGV